MRRVNRDAFDALVKRLERVSRQSPQLYVARIVGLVGLAYGYLLLVLAGALAVTAALVALVIAAPNAATIKIAILLGIVALGLFWAILRGLWVRLEPPQGLRLDRDRAPALFALLDDLQHSLDCPPFHEVLIVSSYNAAVVQIPRLGILGWHKNYLLVGLPLLFSLGPEEFKAVLAHEFAHSSRGYGRLGNWLYRVRRSWERVFEQMARQPSRAAVLLTGFIKWFWPVFNAHAFVLARANEYEADACSARLAGADAAARALTRLPVHGPLLEEQFWNALQTRANHEPEPPANAFAGLAPLLRDGATPEATQRRLRHAFLAETDNQDTHPSLKDRLRALGRLPAGVEQGQFPETLPPTPMTSAAEELLGDALPGVVAKLSADWRAGILPVWRQRHEEARKLAADLAELEQPAEAPPSVEDLWRKAAKLIQLHDDATAVPVLQQILTLAPAHAPANFIQGRHLLAQDDPRGVELVELALAVDANLTNDGLGLLYGHYTRTGQRERLRELQDRAEQFQETLRLAEAERAQLSAQDTFLPPELDADTLAELHGIFAAEPDLAAAAVARRAVKHLPESLSFAVCLEVSVAWWKLRSTAANQELVGRICEKVRLPGHFIVFVSAEKLQAVGKKVFAVAGAPIYQRNR